MPSNVTKPMKTLQNISSYVLGLLAFFMPKLTDTLENTLKQVIANMRVEGLTGQANEILYTQQQQVLMDEMELWIKFAGMLFSFFVALFLYFRDIQAIHAGFHYFWIRLCCFAQAIRWWIVKKLTTLYLNISKLFQRVKRILNTLFSKHTHNN